jgi:hypothetical protein
MRAGAPDEAYAAMLDIARSGLDQHAYDRLTDDLVRA